ncbi:LOW QUALITY PROTEIN: testis-expressed protein 45 [Lagopus leucura]|uniref:LOW QUALITY PROTEIN: testis-expressed protein 45 n=1 Tax=Lagopus leucura TaxID=30410 RepID=UPI001C663B40|nr:LOW QUALITY PROTEIN: testis-expressed protein 45 [Lagopus leucura]
MAARTPIPARLAAVPFPWVSHPQPGAARGGPRDDGRPFSHLQFPPYWGHRRPTPAEPPRSGAVLGRSGAEGGGRCSETRLAFPERPLRQRSPGFAPAPCVRMHADPRVRICSSAMKDSFPCPEAPPPQPALPRAQQSSDGVLCGDREKIGLPPSVHSTSYPAHEVRPAARARHSHSGCAPIIKGDGRPYYHTSHQTQFKGEHGPPAKPSEKHKSRIKFGDPRSSGSTSEQKYAYTALGKREHRFYDKERAAFQIHHTNIRPGDGCTRFSTSMSELFPVHNAEPVAIACLNKNTSSIPRGDEDPERNRALARITTMQLFYPEAGRWNFPPKPDLLLQKHGSNVCLGDDLSGSCFFSTTQHSDYQPPLQPQRVTGNSKSHRDSHIPFCYHSENPITTTQATLVPHRQQKQRLSEEVLQQMKCSHLVLPWKQQNFFSTEQKDEFTPKHRDTAEIQAANCHVSCIPLGTLKEYCSQGKILLQFQTQKVLLAFGERIIAF